MLFEFGSLVFEKQTRSFQPTNTCRTVCLALTWLQFEHGLCCNSPCCVYLRPSLRFVEGACVLAEGGLRMSALGMYSSDFTPGLYLIQDPL